MTQRAMKHARLLLVIAVLLKGSFSGHSNSGAATPDLIRPERLAPYGLELAWFNQVQMDPAVGRMTSWLLDRGTLFVVTDTAVIQAFDAETGRSLWATTVGSPDLLTLKPTAGEHLVAVVNGSTIYLLNRHTGVILWKRQTEGAVGAGPAISPTRVFVPLIRGKIESYRFEWATPEMAAATGTQLLGTTTSEQTGTSQPATNNRSAGAQGAQQASQQAESETLPPDATVAARPISKEELRLSTKQRPGLFVMSWGHALVEPRLTYADSSRERVAWPTDQGLLFVAELDVRADLRFQVQYFLQTNGDIVAPPCIRPGDPTLPNDPNRMLFVATTNGFVHALREYDGKVLWRFSTGEPINQSPALVGDDLYFTTQTGGLYRVKATTGELVWFSRGIRQFVAASDQHVYGVDGINQLVVMDVQTGSRQGQFDVTRYPLRYMNSQTDRIYLANEQGLIQCLRESRLTQPIQHVVPVTQAPKQPPKPARAQPQAQPQPTTSAPTPPAGENPFQ
ncbi:PQQ-binding-like beta-propeller repeat protein [Thermogutta sp.]|uniref:outer membrane protein assembly factor BamB family protein n=1 Tax=Thermogutta sp. TaxID=1962930 RepID=UPI003C7D8695